MVLFLLFFAVVDQIMDLVDGFRMTRLPSIESVNSNEVVFLIGLSLFATQAEVNLRTVLNHMPRYQLVVLSEDFPRPLKKPSAYLPFLETSLSLMSSAWPAKMVSVAAKLAGVVEQKNNKMQTTGRTRMTTEGEGVLRTCCAGA